MGFVDAHCDVISKLMTSGRADFVAGTDVTASLPRLRAGGAKLQFFAIFLSDPTGPDDFAKVLRAIAHYERQVLAQPEMMPVRHRSDLAGLVPGRTIGAMLTLEGVDAVPADPAAIQLLYERGVRAVGITWNHANWAADGAGVPDGGGLTEAGYKLVSRCNELGMIIDVSHLSLRGFWDVAATARRPFIASHSNVHALCPHPRNLLNDQIDHLIASGGMLGLTFVPWFLVPSGERPARAADLLRHLEAVCERGGRFAVGFGSDFDGFDTPLPDLEHPGKYGTLRELLLKRYSAEETEDFLAGNWLRFLTRELPE